MIQSHVLDTIRKEIILSGRDPRYKIEAYSFVLEVINYLHTRAGERRHYTGQELSKVCADFALKQFGPLTQSVFEYWGIQSTSDLGYIVYNLIDINLLKKQQSDSIEDFFIVFDLKEYYAQQAYYTIDKTTVKTIKGA